jgi:hypothetical protein
MRSSGVWPTNIYEPNAQTTRCAAPNWCMKHIFGLWVSNHQNRKTERISSRSLRGFDSSNLAAQPCSKAAQY